MIKLNEKNYLTLVYLRGPLVEYLLPEEYSEDFDTIIPKEERDKLFDDEEYSRPEKVRNLILYLSNEVDDKTVEKFVKILEEKNIPFLPPNWLEIVNNKKQLRKETFHPTSIFKELYSDLMSLPRDFFIERTELCNKIAYWLINFHQSTNFQSNDEEENCAKEAVFLLFYGKQGSGKTFICTEMFRNAELQKEFPIIDSVIKVSMEDVVKLSEVRDFVLERLIKCCGSGIVRKAQIGKCVEEKQLDPIDVDLLFTEEEKTKTNEEKINILMCDRKRNPVRQIILILDNFTDKHKFTKEDFQKNLSFTNFLIFIISHDEDLAKEFESKPETKFDFDPVSHFEETDFIEFANSCLKLSEKERKDEKLLKILNLLRTKFFSLKFLQKLFRCVKDDRFCMRKRLKYYANANVEDEEIQLLFERIENV